MTRFWQGKGKNKKEAGKMLLGQLWKTTGVMMNGKHKIIPIFVPHKGCPNDCIFCNQKKISGQVQEMTAEEIPRIIEAHLSTMKQNSRVEIAFYGGSFTAIDKSVQERFLIEASHYLSDKRITQIRLSTRPDCIDRDNLQMLWRYGVRMIELGVQSMDDEVLRASCRGHDKACVYRAASLIKSMGFKLGIQTMTGLPGDTRDKSLATAREVISMAPEIVRIYPVLVIKGTELERQYIKGNYLPQRLEEAVELCAELLKLYESSNIKVIRIGLQATANINEDSQSDVAAGPVHPAFRQLVESRLMLGKVETAIERQGLVGSPRLVIYTGVSNISNVVGQNKSNIEVLKRKYAIRDIKVSPCQQLSKEVTVSAM